MNFNKHLEIRGSHATFSPSQSAWLRYDEKKILDKITSVNAASAGSEIHEFAGMQIFLRIKYSSIKDLNHSLVSHIARKYWDDDKNDIKENGKKMIKFVGNISKEMLGTIQKHINDAVGFRMTPEQPLYYSDEIYGTADAISFRDKVLRIHDLKTGKVEAHMDQLMVYAALFCLEYNIKPKDIETHLRIYQYNDALLFDPEPEEIQDVINQIIYVKNISSKVNSEV